MVRARMSLALFSLQAVAASTSLGSRAALLKTIAGSRSVLASDACRAEISALVADLAISSPEPNPLASPRISGSWKLVYTDCPLSLGDAIPAWSQPRDDLTQTIDTSAEPWLLRNSEGAPLFTTATAQLFPRSDAPGRSADVTFLELKSMGGLSSEAPPLAGSLGSLDFLFLDEDLLISRGSAGHLFVLERAGPLVPLPRIRRGGKGYYQGDAYFKGMFSTSAPTDPTITRGQLDNLLPNIKLVGIMTGFLGGLTVAFLASNGLLSGQGP